MSEFLLPTKAVSKTKRDFILDEISRKVMSLEKLYDNMADIENKKRTDPKAVIVLLNQMLESDIKLLDVEQSKAERFLRELVSLPVTMFMT